jgi:molybdenum cofactor cytidylyltransferase
MTQRKTAAVILAAGASIRLGEPKQLIEIAGETLLGRAVRIAHEAGCSPVVVVLGAEAWRFRTRCSLRDAHLVINPEWPEGMASSVRVGVAAAASADGVILMTCDQPAVTAQHLRDLLGSREVTASAYGGRRGVPAYFPATSFSALQKLNGDAGARELLKDAPAIDLPGGEFDIDTAADLARLRARFSQGGD